MLTIWLALAGCNTATDVAATDGDAAPTDGVDTDDTPMHTGAPPTGDTGGTTGSGLPVLGGGTHDIANVVVTDVVTTGLDFPRDLEFHPTADELWVVNRGSDSASIVYQPHGQAQSVYLQASDLSGNHFLAKPSALAFNNQGGMATSHEEHDLTQGPPPFGTPEDFMGPTLWTSNSQRFDAGHGSHLDMLHNSPDGAGIAWETGNVFWVFDGWHDSLTRYDFASDHGLGGTDHSDGVIHRYAEGEVSFVPNVVSHIAFDPSSALLYVADSGNNRIATLDTSTGSMGNPLGPNYDACELREVMNSTVTTLVDGGTVGMARPSGLELWGGYIWVTDTELSTVYAFDMAGNVVDWLETGWAAGTLGGMAVDADGDVWLLDMPNHKIVRISPQ